VCVCVCVCVFARAYGGGGGDSGDSKTGREGRGVANSQNLPAAKTANMKLTLSVPLARITGVFVCQTGYSSGLVYKGIACNSSGEDGMQSCKSQLKKHAWRDEPSAGSIVQELLYPQTAILSLRAWHRL
jgi:hypothetical protein